MTNAVRPLAISPLPMLVTLAPILCSAVAAQSGPPPSPVQEVLVTPAPIFEFEFDPNGDRFTWISVDSAEVWVGKVNKQTGGFQPSTGKAEHVDFDGVIPGNGSEWVAAVPESKVIYTKRKPGDTVRLASATVDGDGFTWHPLELDTGDRRVNPAGATQVLDNSSYVLAFHLIDAVNHTIEWRILDQPGTQLTVPKSLGATGARWVPGEKQMVFSGAIDGGRQIFAYDCVTHITSQLTFDSGLKQSVFLWSAPEFPGEKIFFASVKGADQSQLRIYRLLDEDHDGHFDWTVIKTLNGPVGTYFWSPEPFVHNGKSYIFWVASPIPDQPDPGFASQVWLASADPADPFYVSVSDPTLSRFRLDPELYVTDKGPYIYYNRYIQGTPQQYEGVYRVDTGLGPKQ